METHESQYMPKERQQATSQTRTQTTSTMGRESRQPSPAQAILGGYTGGGDIGHRCGFMFFLTSWSRFSSLRTHKNTRVFPRSKSPSSQAEWQDVEYTGFLCLELDISDISVDKIVILLFYWLVSHSIAFALLDRYIRSSQTIQSH